MPPAQPVCFSDRRPTDCLTHDLANVERLSRESQRLAVEVVRIECSSKIRRLVVYRTSIGRTLAKTVAQLPVECKPAEFRGNELCAFMVATGAGLLALEEQMFQPAMGLHHQAEICFAAPAGLGQRLLGSADGAMECVLIRHRTKCHPIPGYRWPPQPRHRRPWPFSISRSAIPYLRRPPVQRRPSCSLPS